ncbi:hypothetical protein Dform_01565 [Dehalogenimonas formicexedens]|uniref:Uncharacterized protein n=1 Tax=Dehalogenimonas formicexedens TaxID=1839801 RepID=A0A1P8F8T9_9CHLR|nr:hypothetical protein [Dehalogenimonas formicexedens]APV44886.1 hypothetical protein Dform_01565 [Dehalogenimonas formicexedens]
MILIVDDYLFLIGGFIGVVWGIAHLVPTGAIIKMFGPISGENKRILAMSWIAEGVALIFIGAVVSLTVAIAGTENDATRIVTWSAAAAMFALAGVNIFTGFRTSIFPIKACVFVDGAAGLLFFIGSIINS